MPIYVYNDKVSKKTVEIIRHFDEYNSLPTEEEMVMAGFTEEEIKCVELVKQIGKGIHLTRGDSWKGSKGNW